MYKKLGGGTRSSPLLSSSGSVVGYFFVLFLLKLLSLEN